MNKVNKGWFKKGKSTSPDTQFKKGELTGNKNPKWKEKDFGYFAIHTWVQRTLGKANKCSNPECNGKSTRYEWSNISNDYKRDIDDWQELCHKCHSIYDKKMIGHIEKRFGVNHNVY